MDTKLKKGCKQIAFFDIALNKLQKDRESFRLDMEEAEKQADLLSMERKEVKKQIVMLQQKHFEQENYICENEEALYDLDDPAIIQFLNHTFFERKNNESLLQYLSKIVGGITGGIALSFAGSYFTFVYPYVAIPLELSAILGTGIYSGLTSEKRKNKKLTKRNEIYSKIYHLEESSTEIENAIKLLGKRVEDIDIALRDINFHIYSDSVELDAINDQIDQIVGHFQDDSQSLEKQESTENKFEKHR